MMDIEDEHNHMRAAFGLRYRFGQPATPAAECLPGGRKPHLKTRLQPGWRLSAGERATLAEIGRRLGRQGLQRVACLAKPDTILAWYRRLIAQMFDRSRHRSP
jgi:hypothetical protein